MGVLKGKYKGHPILIAAMGAIIKKPDGSVRPIHDGLCKRTMALCSRTSWIILDHLMFQGLLD